MKTITLDFETYEQELGEKKAEGYRNALRDLFRISKAKALGLTNDQMIAEIHATFENDNDAKKIISLFGISDAELEAYLAR